MQPQPGETRSAAPAIVNLAAERRLVQRVFERCNQTIAGACAPSSTPVEFLGALVANESGGVADATRFEPAVYRHLLAVAESQSPSYGSINMAVLDRELGQQVSANSAALHARYMTRGFAEIYSSQIQKASDAALRELATSWGYTQIMGYHMVGRPGDVRQLLDPGFHFRMAVWLLSEFAVDFHLDPAEDFAEMFRCWNTGRPNGSTYDPSYVDKGLERMELYRQLRQAQAAVR
ncbi:MAG: hypothetical protein EPN47_19345 [Acidobacteria bacterium]|nr:MAG: hypothetical protein EPN47_19345 [Acidobacteriota bacterium]